MSPEIPNDLPETPKGMEITSTAESMAEVGEAVQERLDKLKIWDSKLDQMDDPTKVKLIKSMDKHTLKDRVIEGYPNLVTDYQDLKAKSLDLLEENDALEVLGGNNLDEVISKLVNDKIDLDKTGDLKMHQRKLGILTTNLRAFTKICDNKLGEVLPAQMGKIEQAKKDASDILNLLNSSLH